MPHPQPLPLNCRCHEFIRRGRRDTTRQDHRKIHSRDPQWHFDPCSREKGQWALIDSVLALPPSAGGFCYQNGKGMGTSTIGHIVPQQQQPLPFPVWYIVNDLASWLTGWLYDHTEWEPWWQLICSPWILIKTTKPPESCQFTTFRRMCLCRVKDFQSNSLSPSPARLSLRNVQSTCWRLADWLTDWLVGFHLLTRIYSARSFFPHPQSTAADSLAISDLVSRWKDLRLLLNLHIRQGTMWRFAMDGWVSGCSVKGTKESNGRI